MLRAAYERMLREYGAQAWWPAEQPFEIMVGAILVQQTTWAAAARAIDALRERDLLSSRALATARTATIEQLIRPAGFYRTKARRLRKLASFVNDAGGHAGLRVESSATLRAKLLGLEGVGEETADAMLLYAFGRAAVVVDAYTRRWYGRMTGSPQTDGRLRALILAEIDTAQDLNELHALIVEHGKRYCRKVPACQPCFFKAQCGYAQADGLAAASE